MDTVLSILAALFIGAALARITIILLERRRRAQGKPPRGGSGGVVGSSAQRIRAAWMAVGITAMGLGVILSGFEQAGWFVAAVGMLLAAQAGIFELIDRARRR